MTHTRLALLPVVVAGLLLTAACENENYGTTSTSTSHSPAAAGSAAVKVASTDLGQTIVTADGRVVYLLTSDKDGKTACTGGCLKAWPPVLVTGTPKATGVTAQLGTLDRSGNTQLTIAGHPAYTYAGDSKAGQANGQGLSSYGGTWWVMAPDGVAVTDSSGGKSSGTRGY